MTDMGAYVSTSAAVKNLAVHLKKAADDLRLLNSGPRCGFNDLTPGFIAPEIIDGAESDEMTDWWSVGDFYTLIILYSVLVYGNPKHSLRFIITALVQFASNRASESLVFVVSNVKFR